MEKNFSIVVEEGGTLLQRQQEMVWTIQLRFSSQNDVSRVYERLSERDIQIDTTRIQPLSKATDNDIGLTPEQREALIAAIQYGYFEIPREISLEELAAKLDISHQALSERFRRAYHTLVLCEIDFDEINKCDSGKTINQ